MYNKLYYLKKSFSIFPGTREPIAAHFLADHYAGRVSERSAGRAALDAVIGRLFRLWVPFRARGVARRFGLDADWARMAARIGRERYVDPNDIALFRITAAEEMDLYMRRYENAAISKAFNPRAWASDCALADKVRFAARCAEHGIPHPRLHAVVEDGALAIQSLPTGPALVLKPAAGEGGSGVTMLDFADWETADRDGFAAYLAPHVAGRRGKWLVQQRIANHRDMADISINALATVRTTTMLDEAGKPEIVTSVLRFPSKQESQVDNIKAGGLMAPVDPETGVLGAACQGRGIREYDTHPVSGAAIVGKRLPGWADAVNLVKRAHRDAFGDYNLVGWDVALTAEGPMILEGNGKPCLIVAQRASRRGIGATRFGALVAHHLKAAAARPN